MCLQHQENLLPCIYLLHKVQTAFKEEVYLFLQKKAYPEQMQMNFVIIHLSIKIKKVD